MHPSSKNVFFAQIFLIYSNPQKIHPHWSRVKFEMREKKCDKPMRTMYYLFLDFDFCSFSLTGLSWKHKCNYKIMKSFKTVKTILFMVYLLIVNLSPFGLEVYQQINHSQSCFNYYKTFQYSIEKGFTAFRIIQIRFDLKPPNFLARFKDK